MNKSPKRESSCLFHVVLNKLNDTSVPNVFIKDTLNN